MTVSARPRSVAPPRRGPDGRSRRRWWAVPVALVLGLVMTGCDTDLDGIDEAGDPTTLVVSETWVADHQGGSGTGGAAGGSIVPARIAALQKAITRLRKETGTGWVGHQDDVTGYLAEITGGSRRGTPTEFMDAYGAALWGIDASALRMGVPDTETVPHMVTTRAGQVVGEVPVLDASLIFTSRSGDDAIGTASQRLVGVRGRVFPGLTVSTTPTLTPEQAAASAAALAGGSAEGTPTLVVLPTAAGVLTWEVLVIVGADGASGTGRYYIDARTGDLVQTRPVAADLAAPVPGASTVAGTRAARGHAATRPARSATTPATRGEPEANSVEVTGTDPLGRQLTAYGLQTGQGVELTDTTTPSWDPASGKGAISTYDAEAITNEDTRQLPGRLWLSPDTTITDPEVLAAQAYSRDILEYYAGLGRSSWDGEGGSLLSSVHFGASSYCNAFFASYLLKPQMVYGHPCTTDAGQVSNSLVEPDVAAHEVTHGVTQTTAGLIYSGQSGALNESFSDYFGNVIGNRIHGNDSVAIAEDSCEGYTSPNSWCLANPDGSFSLRYMLTGNDFDDYLRVINPGWRLELLKISKQDYGGVHFNSRIWNNALWGIRTQLAKIDDLPGNDSPLARAFDRAVYGALATRITPTSGFVDARAAVEQVIIDSQLDPVVLRVAREVFDQDKICTGCPTTTELGGDAVATGSQGQLHPIVSGDRVAWLDLSGGAEYNGYAASLRLGGGGSPALSSSPDSLDLGFAGDAIVSLDTRGRIVRTDDSGAGTVLDSTDTLRTLAAGLAGSDAGAAWLGRGDTVRFADPAGTVSSADIQGLAGDTVDSIGTGGGTVAAGTDGGKVLRWTPGSGGFAQVGQMTGAVLNVAAYGGNVLAIDDTHRAALFTADGRTLEVSQAAWYFGASMSEEYAVWSQATGKIQAGVVPGGASNYPETDVYVLSLATHTIYSLHASPAQQGFPSISGRRVVWQDATSGGDDVLTTVLAGDL